jgi:N-acetylneuraminic acid mutarotase
MARGLLLWVVAVCVVASGVRADWAATGALSIARVGHTLTPLLNGKILVAGGAPSDDTSSTTCVNTAETYDPATGKWTPTQPMTAGRCYHTATLVDDGTGRVFVTGGLRNSTTILASTEYYDPRTNSWTSDSRDNLRNARAYHAAVLLNRGDVLVTGGTDGSGRYLTSAEQYRVDTPLTPWNPVGDLKVARAYHTASILPTGRVLLVGGVTTGGIETDTAEFCSNFVYCTWVRATADLVVARAQHTATVLGNGDVLLTGGFNRGVATGSSEVYDNTLFERTLNDLPATRARHTALFLLDGRVLAVGGVTGVRTPLDTVDIYNPDTRRWTRGEINTLMATPRGGHGAALLFNGNVLVAGGVSNGNSATPTAEVFQV